MCWVRKWVETKSVSPPSVPSDSLGGKSAPAAGNTCGLVSERVQGGDAKAVQI